MNRKTEIGQCARRLILDKGYETFRLDDVLLEMNLSKGGFYHYYKSVELLLEDLIREDFAADMALMDRVSAVPSVKQAIVQVIQNLSLHEESDVGILQALQSVKSQKLYLTLLESAWYQPFKDRLSDLLRKGIESGELHGVDVFVVCELVEAINRHANRYEILGVWEENESGRFYRAALKLLAYELNMQAEMSHLIQQS